MKEKILAGKTYLGIELGSTRIKACLVDDSFTPIAVGGYEWENKLENGYWTYDISLVHSGLRAAFADLRRNVKEQYGAELTTLGAIGISGMMHGYLAFDKDDNLLTPFRTWRNTTTGKAADVLTELFGFNIPQRWSIAHLYQAILNGEEHLPRIAHITTLAGYVHYLLTGRWELGVGDASGMFPTIGADYNGEMLDKFDNLISDKGYPWKIRDILPKAQLCGDHGARLTDAGARFLDESGKLTARICVCPPEGDGDTGMTATGSVRRRTGNVSAGTSVFSMLVLDKPLGGVYPEIDVISTPSGDPVAMVHCNNGCSELDAWVKVFGEFSELLGNSVDKSALYNMLYNNALTADADCGGVVAYNYLASEPVAGVEGGAPMYFCPTGGRLTLGGFFRAQLYATVAVLRIGMNILSEKENITADTFNAHGGLFKVRGVAQQILADALRVPVAVSESAGEGGAWGMALLAAYSATADGMTLEDWLDEKVFGAVSTETRVPTVDGMNGFDKYFERYVAGLAAQRAL
ncbi:MAG: ATPase [Clostridia bacterium]|nr:ATPase [Clostridia bacterium]